MKMGRNLTNTTETEESTQPVSQTGSEKREEAQPSSETAIVAGPSISPEAPAETAGSSATPRKSQGTQTARIESLKRAIQQGEYRPLPEEIADALIYEMTTEGRPDLAGLENNMDPLDTVRAGSRGSATGNINPRPGSSATPRRRTALHVASNGSLAENPATMEKDFSDGNAQDGGQGNENRSEDQRVGGRQTNEDTMNDEQMKNEPINRSA
jgi:anti-sigma28 factor (negative regulator of flagellin synthesis)